MSTAQVALNRGRDGAAAPSTIVLGGLPITVTDRAEAARTMVDAALARRGTGLPPVYMTSANARVLSLCARDPAARDLFLAADAIHADGMPLVFASRLRCRAALPGPVPTTELFHDVAQEAVRRGASFYLLGGRKEVADAAVKRVRASYPQLRVAGWRHGYFAPEHEVAVLGEIRAARPDILWLCLGAPREQEFVVRNRKRLVGAGLVKTSGGLFDVLSGADSRAPQWMQDAGLEWLHRLRLEPGRLFSSYAVSNPHAAYLLLTRSR